MPVVPLCIALTYFMFACVIHSKIVLWLNANFKTGFRKRKFGEKPGIFDLSNAKK